MTRYLFAALLLVTTMIAGAQNTPIIYTGFPLYAKTITPHNTNPLTNYLGNPQPQYVYVGVAGDVVCLPSEGDGSTVVTFVGIGAGGVVPVLCKRVNATGTTATNLIGLY